jgi:hypothetical protein
MTVTDYEGQPLPTVLMAPWIADNAAFVSSLQNRNEQLRDLEVKLRECLEAAELIKKATEAEPTLLAAIDAANAQQTLGEDQESILMQTVWVGDNGYTIATPPLRITGLSGEKITLAVMPMRVAQECLELRKANDQITIADTSYWSLLMETNQAITRAEEHSEIDALQDAVRVLVTDDEAFLDTIRNPNVIAMSKSNQTDYFARTYLDLKDISDRYLLGRTLEPGEYIKPESLTKGTTGRFGVEKRRFSAAQRSEVETLYSNDLGVIFFKPHPWSRAYRIESHLVCLHDEQWLMALLAAISKHTGERTIVEPWPQFMADYTAKKILSAVCALYGDLNARRLPLSVNPVRTRHR